MHTLRLQHYYLLLCPSPNLRLECQSNVSPCVGECISLHYPRLILYNSNLCLIHRLNTPHSLYAFAAGSATYIRWGKKTCQKGELFADGFAFGFRQKAGQSTQALHCIPYPVEINDEVTLHPQEESVQLTPAVFSLHGADNQLDGFRSLNGKSVVCTFCHTARQETVSSTS